MTTDAMMTPAHVAVTAVELVQGPAGPVGATGPQGASGSPPIDYGVSPTTGQVAFPLSPPPTLPGSISFSVNNIVYRAPNSLSYDSRTAVLIWTGGFILLPSDDVHIHYF